MIIHFTNLWYVPFSGARINRFFWVDVTILRGYWEVTLLGLRVCGYPRN